MSSRWISVLANVALAAIVCWLLSRRTLVVPVGSQVPSNRQSAPVSPSKAPTPFHWSQLEAPDYQTYIANLRAVGCPEQTVAEIISADVDALYAPRRRRLDDQERMLPANDGSTSLARRKALLTRRDDLWREETNLVAQLLGHAPAVWPATTQPTAADAPGIAAAADRATANPSLPLAFAAMDDTNALGLGTRQQTILAGIRRSFISRLGTNPDPASAEYDTRWRQAQPEADHTLQSLLGYQAYRDLQTSAARQRRVNGVQPAGPVVR